ncbi:hypothetical protein M8J77_016619 [Diaphorina citri]|nr:hypothetical protein M8J77_016619 [Diaphorina citri]
MFFSFSVFDGRLVVNQIFEADILPEYVIRGNTGILKCNIPSFVTEFVHVDAWISDEGEVQNVVNQAFEAEIMTEYVIRGNAGILKCSIPSFVADYVLVDAWINDEGAIVENVVSQDYVTEAENEYVIRGNSAVMKCKIPSFVSDFVSIDAWLSDEGEELSLQSASHDYVVSQQYSTGSEEEYVIKGNSATLKCKIPSFVNDFVTVDSWLDSEGNVYSMQDTPDYVVTQQYEAEADNEYVIRGNSVAMKCEIPSFVADFVSVLNWSDSDGNEFLPGEEIVIQQFYQTRVNDEFVLIGNSATLKCLIPSFVADFVSIAEWLDDEGTSYTSQGIVVHQSYQTQVIDEYVLRGNSATLKCLVPSFVADFVQVTEWMDEEGRTFRSDDDTSVDVISQYYEAQVYDVFVIKGNAAVFKCNLPSFVSDHLDVVSWADTDGGQYQIDNQDFVVSQSYTVNIMDEHVLKGNSAVLKCHIPSFVADYVAVESWISDLGEELFVDMTESTGAAQLSLGKAGKSQQYAIAQMVTHPDTNHAQRCLTSVIHRELVTGVLEYSPLQLGNGKYLVLPSGELHIRDVGPEDGYKSYQCRTKHRLTGETRLSATKGRLVITEPVGATRPKFPTIDNSRSFNARLKESLVLLCPAQAFPVPFFRRSLSHSSEPVGAMKPKFSVKDSLIKESIGQGKGLALLCPAQAFPVPFFR